MHADQRRLPLAERVAIVTGAGSGIGRAAALALAADGALIMALDESDEGARETVRLIEAAGRRATSVAASITDRAAMKALVRRCEQDYGRIDILVNNASIGGGGAFEDISEDRYDRLFEVNVKGTFFVTQAVIPAMKTRAFGRIVNISSLIAVRGTAGNSHYAGAKAALFGFARSWAVEFAPHGITVNTVVPALTLTPMTTSSMSEAELEIRARAVPFGRLATPEDVVPIIRFLCTPEAGFVTGQAISANGGEFVGAL
jgi:NAD(P)-dependent dehydrogenase (short-subunit alcohol dehydrogenase family)